MSPETLQTPSVELIDCRRKELAESGVQSVSILLDDVIAMAVGSLVIDTLLSRLSSLAIVSQFLGMPLRLPSLIFLFIDLVIPPQTQGNQFLIVSSPAISYGWQK